jgi:hypothetical protein
MTTLELYCDVCAEIRLFERPPCVEKHAADCPDWACTACTTGVFVAPAIMLVDRVAPILLGSRGAEERRAEEIPAEERRRAA